VIAALAGGPVHPRRRARLLLVALGLPVLIFGLLAKVGVLAGGWVTLASGVLLVVFFAALYAHERVVRRTPPEHPPRIPDWSSRTWRTPSS
jgi:hypothetical protein